MKTVTQDNDVVWSSGVIVRELADVFGRNEAMGQLNKNNSHCLAEFQFQGLWHTSLEMSEQKIVI